MASLFESVHVGWRHAVKPRLLSGHPRGDHPGAECDKVAFRNRYMLVMMVVIIMLIMVLLAI